MNSSKITRQTFIFSILFLCIIMLNSSSAQQDLRENLNNLIKQNGDQDISHFILSKQINNRIVIFADNGHGKHMFMQTIINYLNYWIDTLQKNSNHSLPKKLILFLESDSNHVNSVYKYFATKNPYDLLDPADMNGYQFTSAVIEFYDDLRKINERVNLLNENIPPDEKISFRLYGPEKVIDLNDWSGKKRDNFYLHERDEYSSKQIINLLEQDSSAKALIFYGGGHLITQKTQKLQSNPEQGYFIGYYLSEYFKNRGGYYSIDQVSAILNSRLNECYRTPQKNYAIENSVFDGESIPLDMFPQFTDASVILFDKDIIQPHISRIWSSNLTDCFFNNIETYMNSKSEYNKWVISSWFEYLSLISEGEFQITDFNDSASVLSGLNKWMDWKKNNKVDAAEKIINQSIAKNLISRLENAEGQIAGSYEYKLSNLVHGKVWYGKGAPSKIRAEKYYNCLQINSKALITDDLINLLWIGNSEERAKALLHLKNTFSLNYQTAKEWTEWWRNSEFCN